MSVMVYLSANRAVSSNELFAVLLTSNSAVSVPTGTRELLET